MTFFIALRTIYAKKDARLPANSSFFYSQTRIMFRFSMVSFQVCMQASTNFAPMTYAVRTYEKSVSFYETRKRNIPEGVFTISCRRSLWVFKYG
jgi:hypothetical protein